MASAVVSYKLTLSESSAILRALDREANYWREAREAMSAPGRDKDNARRFEAEARELSRKLYEATA